MKCLQNHLLLILFLCLCTTPAEALSLYDKVKDCTITEGTIFKAQSQANESKEDAATEVFAVLVEEIKFYVMTEVVETCDLTPEESVDLLFAVAASSEAYSVSDEVLNGPVQVGYYELDGRYIIQLTLEVEAAFLDYMKDAIILPESEWKSMDHAAKAHPAAE